METEPNVHTIGGLLTRRVGVLLVSAGVVNAAAYVVIRVACDVFYGPLGLSPEDVGLNGPELLWRAAGIVALTVVFAVVLGAPVLELVGLLGPLPRWPARVYAGWGALLVATLLVSWRAASLLLLAGFVVSGAVHVWTHPPTRRWVRGLVIYGAIVAAMTLGTVYAAAVVDRHRVIDGKGLDSLDRTLLPWDAAVAELDWTASTPPPKSIADLPCVSYLGSNGSTAIAIDPRGSEPTVLRIPAASVTVRTHFDTRAVDFVCTPSGVVREKRAATGS